MSKIITLKFRILKLYTLLKSYRLRSINQCLKNVEKTRHSSFKNPSLQVYFLHIDTNLTEIKSITKFIKTKQYAAL